MQELKDNSSGKSLREIQADLERLERREWWRWATALLIMLFLMLGVFALSLPRKELLGEYQLERAVPGLFAVIVVFSVFVVYQQLQISRMRRQLSSQIGMLAALEVLRPVSSEEQEGWKERRRVARHPFDQRLKVKAPVEGQDIIFYGRIIDVSELGLGAVISGSFKRGDTVTLEFSMGTGKPTLLLNALVRYSRGFRHGFEYSAITNAEREQIKAGLEQTLTIRR
jgi:hypothetical protein